MKPYLSIIIPYYNNSEGLTRLLASIGKSKKAPAFDIIVVDDGSSLRPPRSDIRLPKNRGPAIARNRGVEKAKGEFVVFLDGDVEVFPDTLYQIAKVFKDDPDVVALTGVWVKEQKSKAFSQL